DREHALRADHSLSFLDQQVEVPVRRLPGGPESPVELERVARSNLGWVVGPRNIEWHHLGIVDALAGERVQGRQPVIGRITEGQSRRFDPQPKEWPVLIEAHRARAGSYAA